MAGLKKNTKSKAVAIKKHAAGTGGGEPSKPLSDIDTEILEIMNPTQIEGLTIEEQPVLFDFSMEGQVAETGDAEEIPVEIIMDESQPSTSGAYDHSYVTKQSSPRKTTKKMNKASRLSKSIEVSQKLLKSVEKRNNLLEEYYEEKIKYYRNKNIYLKNKTDCDNKLASSLCDIRDILREKL